MKLPETIYLDSAFIIAEYEVVKKVVVPIRVTKKSAITGNLSAGFASSGSSVEEEKEFPISVRKMYSELTDHLSTYPYVDLDKVEDDALPEIFWTKALFCGGHHTQESSGKITGSADFFRLQTSIGQVRRTMDLVTNDTYFSTGFDQLSKHGYAFYIGLILKAEVLVRVLYLDEHYPVGAPMIVTKLGNFTKADVPIWTLPRKQPGGETR